MRWVCQLLLICAVLGDGAARSAAQARPEAKSGDAIKTPAPPAEEIVKLDSLEVRAKSDDPGYDATGMGSHEQQLRDPPFSNDLISDDALEDDPVAMELRSELQQIASPSAVDLATGDARLSLRGFPAPVMRNGFVTMGASDMLNTSRTINIQGALVPVLGRAAPGGILDFITWRPRTTAGRRFDYSISSLDRQTSAVELTGPAVPKKVWQRIAADWSRRTGPEEFAVNETRAVSGAVTWRHSAAASTLFALDFQQVHATAAPGIPEYRLATGRKLAGPYLPLAGFNALGPEAGVRRRTTAATILFDGQPHKKLAVRAGVEAWWRAIEQDRFTTSVYNVALGRFDGTREPRHLEQPQAVMLAHAELTGRFSGWGGEHKLMGAVSHSWGDYEREEYALPTAARNALPASVRLFDPDTPDYSRPAFSRERYSRVLADRQEKAEYTSIEASHRMAVQQGRLVFTSGLRQDYVAMRITDRRIEATMPRIRDRVDQLTFHGGVNYQVRPSRLLAFATVSTAFEPSSRVDARTGRLQPNEMTRGFEGGMKWRWPERQVEASVAAFSLFNEDISRRNPLYDDPIFDANQTQPQLVASGEETFRGGRVEGRWKPSAPLTIVGRVAYARAITTASPDLPEEVGRAITRLPPITAGGSMSYSFPQKRWSGLSVNGSWSYVSGFTATYADAQRDYLEYPGYNLFGVGGSYSRRLGKRTHSVSVAVRNLFDYDFVQKQHRMGAEREWVLSYRLTM